MADILNGLATISRVPSAGWCRILTSTAFCEVSKDQSAGTPGGTGDLGFKVLTSSNPFQLTAELDAELANGRLAMMAIIGMFFQDGLTGSAWGELALYTDSPRRAFEDKMGVLPPVCFWDPFQLAKNGSKENFLRHRGVEIKRGRFSL